MNDLSSILNWIGNTIGNSALGTTATTLKGAIAELADRTTKKTANPQLTTDGAEPWWPETTLTKVGNVVECKLRFSIIATTQLRADWKIFVIPEGFRPANTIRPIVTDWGLTNSWRFNIYTNGEVRNVDPIPNGTQFIMTLFYMT